MGVTETRLRTDSPERTMAFGAWLASNARPGWVIGLAGDLGAGKTTFTKGFARGAGVDPAEVTSPTFTFLHVYDGRFPVYHLDLYRLETAEALADLGVDEYLGGNGVALVEWFENVPGVLPEERLEIRMAVGTEGEDVREITMRGVGEGWDELLEEARAWH